MELKRRQLVKNFGATVVGGSALARVVHGNDSERQSVRVVYAGREGRILQVGPYSYVIRGADTKEEYDSLRDKLRGMTSTTSGGDFSTQIHDDSGVDDADGTYQGVGWDIHSEFWAQADNGTLYTEGATDANWWVDAYWNDGTDIPAQITISTTVRADHSGGGLSLTWPPGWNVSSNQEEATLTHEFEHGEHHPTLSYSKGTIVWEGDCFHGASQDTSVKFAFDDGETQFHGTFIDLDDIGHCLL